MYAKLMVRGLLRHRKRGRRLFALMALCAAALVFLISFSNDFARQNRDQFIALQSGHLRVVPADSPILADSFSVLGKESASFLKLDESFNQWLAMQDEIEGVAPIIERVGASYNLDGEYETWMPLIAIPAAALHRVFPMATVVAGTDDLTWAPFMREVPVLRRKIDTLFGGKNPDTSRLTRDDFACSDDDFPRAILRFGNDFLKAYPRVFPGRVLPPAERKRIFLDTVAEMLADPEMPSKIDPARFETYDWRLDDAITAARENTDESLVSFYNMRVLDALYPDLLSMVSEPVRPGQRVSIQIAPFESEGPITLPIVIPARYEGLVEFVPLYMANNFIDLNAFRHYMNLSDDDATSLVIRLKDVNDTDPMKRLIQDRLREMGSDAAVVDWKFLNRLSLTTGTAMSAVISILIAVFAAILLLFTVNLVMTSLVQRRREIGTGLAMGLSAGQTVFIMTGEVAVIVGLSSLAGAAIGAAAVALAARFGVPGMVFFSGGRLYMTPQWKPVIQTILILLPSSILVSLIPLSRLLKCLPVDLFKEEAR